MSEGGRRLTVASYNIRAAIGPGPLPAAWWRQIERARLERIARVIADLDPDLAAAGVPAGHPGRHSYPGQAIDHVLVRGLRVASCRVATEAGDASDHWPVVAELVI